MDYAQSLTVLPALVGGVGGAPGEDVTVKAGASSVEPEATLVGGFLRMNVDKGQQLAGGADALVLGNVANSRRCEEPVQWELKRLAAGPLPVTTDDSGRLWLFVGTDSGFESKTAIYYTRMIARLERLTSGSAVGVVAP